MLGEQQNDLCHTFASAQWLGRLREHRTIGGEYLALLEPHLERGECCLAGSSFGGIIAFEMARQYQEGKHVSLPVVMIDSPGQGKSACGHDG